MNDERALAIMSRLPATVLPETYLLAKQALEKCAHLDECPKLGE